MRSMYRDQYVWDVHPRKICISTYSPHLTWTPRRNQGEESTGVRVRLPSALLGCMIEMERTSNGAARHALLVKFKSTKVQILTHAPPAHAQHTGVYATPKNKKTRVSGVQRGLSQVCLSCAPSPRRHASAILRLLCALRPTGRGPRTRIWPTEMP